jgi:hypothetical protein
MNLPRPSPINRKIRSGLLLAALVFLIFSAFVLPTPQGSTASHVMAVAYLAVFIAVLLGRSPVGPADSDLQSEQPGRTDPHR